MSLEKILKISDTVDPSSPTLYCNYFVGGSMLGAASGYAAMVCLATYEFLAGTPMFTKKGDWNTFFAIASIFSFTVIVAAMAIKDYKKKRKLEVTTKEFLRCAESKNDINSAITEAISQRKHVYEISGYRTVKNGEITDKIEISEETIGTPYSIQEGRLAHFYRSLSKETQAQLRSSSPAITELRIGVEYYNNTSREIR